jgi:NADH-quinone oxidoreductase subunit A
MKEYLPSDFLPILVLIVAAIGFIVTTMIVTHSIGPKRNSELKDAPFECGIDSEGDARTPISIKYFLTAILFVLFDGLVLLKW